MGRMRKINEGHPHAALRTVREFLPTITPPESGTRARDSPITRPMETGPSGMVFYKSHTFHGVAFCPVADFTDVLQRTMTPQNPLIARGLRLL